MVLTHRPVTAEDAEEVAALMTRIAADHPTGFELSASEVRELLADYPGVAVEGGWDGADLVAYTAILPRAPHDGSQHFLLFGDVDPARLGEGHGIAMLGRALDAARRLHAVGRPGRAVRASRPAPWPDARTRPACWPSTASASTATTS